MTQEEFIERCTKLWKGRFDYSLVEYKNLKSRIKIICPVHGVYEQVASGHYDGKQCFKCARKASRQYMYTGSC